LRCPVKNNILGAVKDIFTSFLLPAVIKPAQSGSSIGVSIIRAYADIQPALEEAIKHGDQIIIEEYIHGVEASCAVIEGFREQKLYALPPIEIRTKNDFFDYDAKYGGETEEIVPGRFSAKTKQEIEDLAKDVHNLLGLRHYSRTDFIIHPRRGIYVLEINTLPGMTQESLITRALHAIGSNTHEFINHVIQLELGV